MSCFTVTLKISSLKNITRTSTTCPCMLVHLVLLASTAFVCIYLAMICLRETIMCIDLKVIILIKQVSQRWFVMIHPYCSWCIEIWDCNFTVAQAVNVSWINVSWGSFRFTQSRHNKHAPIVSVVLFDRDDMSLYTINIMQCSIWWISSAIPIQRHMVVCSH
jgi:hypothetical protein